MGRRLRKKRRGRQRRWRGYFKKNLAEEVTCLVLNDFLKISLIIRWRRSKKCGEEDLDGIDFFVAINAFNAVVFQVKMIPDRPEEVLVKNFLKRYPRFRGKGNSYKELVLARHFHYHPHIGRIVFLEEKDLRAFSSNRFVRQKISKQIREAVFESPKS